MNIHHINCGTLIVEGYPTVVCHCLLVEHESSLVLIDTGIGLADVRNPVERLGQELIDGAGFQFNEVDTAIRRIEALGFSRDAVQDIVLTHCDPDHTGGLADFPDAKVHVATEELQNVSTGNPRYVTSHFAHDPNWQAKSDQDSQDWFGLLSRPVRVSSCAGIRLIPLFGHTLGHCGVAIRHDAGWTLHVGDAYYLRAEIDHDDHPVAEFAASRADNDELRRASLAELRRLARDHASEIDMTGYHDITELPEHVQP